MIESGSLHALTGLILLTFLLQGKQLLHGLGDTSKCKVQTHVPKKELKEIIEHQKTDRQKLLSTRIDGYFLLVNIRELARISHLKEEGIGSEIVRQAEYRISLIINRIDSESLIFQIDSANFGVWIENSSISEEVFISSIGDLTNKLDCPYRMHDREFILTSLVSVVKACGESIEDLIKKADIAMFHKDTWGHVPVHANPPIMIFQEEMAAAILDKEQLQADLSVGIERGELFLEYQPLVDLQDKNYKTVGFEALVRWHHPTRGVLMPGIFIPIAEEYGLITLISDFVMAEACRQLVEWNIGPSCYVSINVSGWDLQQNNLVEKIQYVLETTGIDPALVNLELTETAFVDVTENQILRVAQELRDLGLGLSIDDFGTGYNCLFYLALPFNYLKIDRTFVSGKGCSLPVCDYVGALAHHQNRKVVAEGIETVDQARAMRDFQIDIGQGYHFSRPLSATDAISRIMRENLFSPQPSQGPCCLL